MKLLAALLAMAITATAADQWVNINTQSRKPVPTWLDGYTPPPASVLIAHGWRLWDGTEPAVPDGQEVLARALVQDPAKPERAIMQHTLGSIAERQAREAAAAAEAESNRVVIAGWNNAFLLVCDQVAQRDTHVKLSFEELPVYLKAIKAANRDTYDTLRDGLVTLNLALTKKSPHGKDWWDFCQWDQTPAAVALAQQILAGLQ